MARLLYCITFFGLLVLSHSSLRSKAYNTNVETQISASEDLVIPRHYTVEILDIWTTSTIPTGKTEIRTIIQILALKPTSIVTLNLDYQCTIHETKIDRSTPTSITYTIEDAQQVQFNLNSSMKVNETAVLTILHSCPVSSMYFAQGLYFNEAPNGDRIIVTQFEANDARRMFPCFDAPRFKAPIFLRLNSTILRANETAFSNGQQKESISGGFIEFEETIDLPIYLFALTIGKFARAQAVSLSGTAISALYLPAFSPNIKNQTEMVLTALNDSLNYMTEYTQHKYGYKKLDIVFAPLKYGGMENYGLITETINSVERDIVAHGKLYYKVTALQELSATRTLFNPI